MTGNQQVSEAERAFREAGFNEELAEEGARRMDSGRYFSFVDVASSLSAFNAAPGVTRAKVEEAGRKFEAEREAARSVSESYLDALDDVVFGPVAVDSPAGPVLGQ